jgi:hypothetical protein
MATMICHCNDCRKYSGTSFGSYLFIHESEFAQKGEVKSFEVVGDSGRTLQRNFCVNCGSHMAEYGPDFAGLVVIPTGTLDDSSWIKPQLQCYAGRVDSWVSFPDDMHGFDAMPPMEHLGSS